MKLKYYMRGLGIGILITTVLLSFGGKKEKLTDKEIIARAGGLGMVMKEDDINDKLEEVLEQSLEKEVAENDLVEGDVSDSLDRGPDTAIVTEAPEPLEEATEVDVEEPLEEATEVGVEEPLEEATEVDVEEPLEEATEVGVDEPTEEATYENVSELSQITFTIERGMSSRQVSELLAEKGLIDNSEDFDNFIKGQGKASVIRIGTYTLARDSGYQAILNAIAG